MLKRSKMSTNRINKKDRKGKRIKRENDYIEEDEGEEEENKEKEDEFLQKMKNKLKVPDCTYKFEIDEVNIFYFCGCNKDPSMFYPICKACIDNCHKGHDNGLIYSCEGTYDCMCGENRHNCLQDNIHKEKDELKVEQRYHQEAHIQANQHDNHEDDEEEQPDVNSKDDNGFWRQTAPQRFGSKLKMNSTKRKKNQMSQNRELVVNKLLEIQEKENDKTIKDKPFSFGFRLYEILRDFYQSKEKFEMRTVIFNAENFFSKSIKIVEVCKLTNNIIKKLIDQPINSKEIKIETETRLLFLWFTYFLCYHPILTKYNNYNLNFTSISNMNLLQRYVYMHKFNSFWEFTKGKDNNLEREEIITELKIYIDNLLNLFTQLMDNTEIINKELIYKPFEIFNRIMKILIVRNLIDINNSNSSVNENANIKKYFTIVSKTLKMIPSQKIVLTFDLIKNIYHTILLKNDKELIKKIRKETKFNENEHININPDDFNILINDVFGLVLNIKRDISSRSSIDSEKKDSIDSNRWKKKLINNDFYIKKIFDMIIGSNNIMRISLYNLNYAVDNICDLPDIFTNHIKYFNSRLNENYHMQINQLTGNIIEENEKYFRNEGVYVSKDDFIKYIANIYEIIKLFKDFIDKELQTMPKINKKIIYLNTEGGENEKMDKLREAVKFSNFFEALNGFINIYANSKNNRLQKNIDQDIKHNSKKDEIINFLIRFIYMIIIDSSKNENYENINLLSTLNINNFLSTFEDNKNYFDFIYSICNFHFEKINPKYKLENPRFIYKFLSKIIIRINPNEIKLEINSNEDNKSFKQMKTLINMLRVSRLIIRHISTEEASLIDIIQLLKYKIDEIFSINKTRSENISRLSSYNEKYNRESTNELPQKSEVIDKNLTRNIPGSIIPKLFTFDIYNENKEKNSKWPSKTSATNKCENEIKMNICTLNENIDIDIIKKINELINENNKNKKIIKLINFLIGYFNLCNSIQRTDLAYYDILQTDNFFTLEDLNELIKLARLDIKDCKNLMLCLLEYKSYKLYNIPYDITMSNLSSLVKLSPVSNSNEFYFKRNNLNLSNLCGYKRLINLAKLTFEFKQDYGEKCEIYFIEVINEKAEMLLEDMNTFLNNISEIPIKNDGYFWNRKYSITAYFENAILRSVYLIINQYLFYPNSLLFKSMHLVKELVSKFLECEEKFYKIYTKTDFLKDDYRVVGYMENNDFYNDESIFKPFTHEFISFAEMKNNFNKFHYFKIKDILKEFNNYLLHYLGDDKLSNKYSKNKIDEDIDDKIDKIFNTIDEYQKKNNLFVKPCDNPIKKLELINSIKNSNELEQGVNVYLIKYLIDFFLDTNYMSNFMPYNEQFSMNNFYKIQNFYVIPIFIKLFEIDELCFQKAICKYQEDLSDRFDCLMKNLAKINICSLSIWESIKYYQIKRLYPLGSITFDQCINTLRLFQLLCERHNNHFQTYLFQLAVYETNEFTSEDLELLCIKRKHMDISKNEESENISDHLKKEKKDFTISFFLNIEKGKLKFKQYKDFEIFIKKYFKKLIEKIKNPDIYDFIQKPDFLQKPEDRELTTNLQTFVYELYNYFKRLTKEEREIFMRDKLEILINSYFENFMDQLESNTRKTIQTDGNGLPDIKNFRTEEEYLKVYENFKSNFNNISEFLDKYNPYELLFNNESIKYVEENECEFSKNLETKFYLHNLLFIVMKLTIYHSRLTSKITGLFDKSITNYESLSEIQKHIREFIIETFQGTEEDNFLFIYNETYNNTKQEHEKPNQLYKENLYENKIVENFPFLKYLIEIKRIMNKLSNENNITKETTKAILNCFLIINSIVSQQKESNQVNNKGIIKLVLKFFPLKDSLLKICHKYIKYNLSKNDKENVNIENNIFEILQEKFKTREQNDCDLEFKLICEIFIFISIIYSNEKFSELDSSNFINNLKIFISRQREQKNNVEITNKNAIIIDDEDNKSHIDISNNEIVEQNKKKIEQQHFLTIGKFFMTQLSTVEFLIRDFKENKFYNKKINFFCPSKIYNLPEQSIDLFYEKVDRTSSTSKLKFLISNINSMYNDINFYSKTNENIQNFFKDNYIHIYNFASSSVINIIFLMFYKDQSFMNSWNYNLILFISFVQIVTNIIFSIIYFTTTSKFVNASLKLSREISMIDIFRYYLNLIVKYFFDEEIILCFLNTLILSICLLYPNLCFLYPSLLFSIKKFSSTISGLIEAFMTSYIQIIEMIGFLVILVYFYANIGFFFMTNQFEMTFDSGNHNTCSSLLECFVLYFNYGIRAGGGIGDILQPKAFADNWYIIRWITDMIFYVTVILLIMNMINGIIISTFFTKRKEKEAREEDKINRCFICNRQKINFLIQKQDFDYHVEYEHNPKDYLRYFIWITNIIKETDLDADQSYIKKCIDDNNVEFFPVSSTIYLKDVIRETDTDDD